MRLAFSDEGSGPVVVLLHGFPFDRTMWTHQKSTLGSSYRMIAPDLRGHGSTAAPDGVYTIDEMADDVLELLDDLQIFEPVVLGGHSMGGYLALSIASRYAERVKALILINTRASADTPEMARFRQTMAAETDATGETAAFVASMVPKLFAKRTFERHPELIDRMRSLMERTTPRAIAGTLRGLATRPDRQACLSEIVAPTLVLAGSEDALIPLKESEQMANMIPHARLQTVAEAGHLAPLENPTESDLALLKFLKDLDQ